MNKQQLKQGLSKLGALVLLAASASAFGFQDTESGGDFPTMDEVLNGGASGEETPEERMRRLFSEVETTLLQVDLLLTDAAAGDTSSLAKVDESGIAELLRNSVDRGRQVQNDILTIIEIAQSLSSSSQSSGSSPSGQPSPGSEGQDPNSPLNRGEQGQSSESTPEAPEEKPGGEKEEPGAGEDGEKDGPKPDDKPGGQDPNNPEGDPKSDGENRESGAGKEGATASGANPSSEDGWGNLPSHVRDTFSSEGRTELPLRYRDWIDQYYRKLNKRSPRR